MLKKANKSKIFDNKLEIKVLRPEDIIGLKIQAIANNPSRLHKDFSDIEELIKMQKTDVLIIGGSAAGIVAATTGKSFYPDKDFLLLRMEEEVLVPCGIPYIFGSLGSSEKNLVSDAMFTKLGIKLKIGLLLKRKWILMRNFILKFLNQKCLFTKNIVTVTLGL